MLWESTRTFVASGTLSLSLIDARPYGLSTDLRMLTYQLCGYAVRLINHSPLLGNKLLLPGGFTDANFYRARKEIVHALRYLLFAIQLVRYGAISDFGAANSYLADILRFEHDDSFDIESSGCSSEKQIGTLTRPHSSTITK